MSKLKLSEDFTPKFPNQPVHIDEGGVERFVPNAIVKWAVSSGKIDLNEVARLPSIPKDDHAQLAQLIGYSVSGWGGLSYVTDAHWSSVKPPKLLPSDDQVVELVDELHRFISVGGNAKIADLLRLKGLDNTLSLPDELSNLSSKNHDLEDFPFDLLFEISGIEDLIDVLKDYNERCEVKELTGVHREVRELVYKLSTILDTHHISVGMVLKYFGVDLEEFPKVLMGITLTKSKSIGNSVQNYLTITTEKANVMCAVLSDFIKMIDGKEVLALKLEAESLEEIRDEEGNPTLWYGGYEHMSVPDGCVLAVGYKVLVGKFGDVGKIEFVSRNERIFEVHANPTGYTLFIRFYDGGINIREPQELFTYSHKDKCVIMFS